MKLITKLNESKQATLRRQAEYEAVNAFNIECRGGKPCITFRNVIVNTNDKDIVGTLFDLRVKYVEDKINGVI